MKPIYFGRGLRKWTLGKCIAEARKYKTIKEWRKNNQSSYISSHKNGWNFQCTSHMEHTSKGANKKWTLAKCLTEAKKYKTRGEWGTKNNSCYQSAKKNGWFDECVAHMNPVKFHKWTPETCITEAKKYKTKGEWIKKSNYSYQASFKFGCHAQCIAHMDIGKMRWTLEMCLAHAKKFKTKSEWMHSPSWQSARRHKWLAECYKQFKR